MARPVQRGPDRGHLTVHHAARRDDVRPGLDLRHGHLGVDPQRAVVVHPAVLVEHPAVPVLGELVDADVPDDHRRVAHLGPYVAQRRVEHAVRVEAPGAVRVVLQRDPEEDHTADAGLHGFDDRLAQGIAGVLDDTGHRADRDRFGGTLLDEHGQHQVARLQTGLGDQASQGGGPPKPSRALVRKHRCPPGDRPYPSLRPRRRPAGRHHRSAATELGARGEDAPGRSPACRAHPPRTVLRPRPAKF